MIEAGCKAASREEAVINSPLLSGLKPKFCVFMDKKEGRQFKSMDCALINSGNSLFSFFHCL